MTDPEVVRAWRAVIGAHARVIEAMAANARAQYGVTLNEFEALLHIALTEDDPIQQKTLAQRLTLTPGGITRLLDRLETAGWVARADHDTDRRAKTLVLTPAGRKQFERMNASHERDIETYFGAYCTPGELRTITRALERVHNQAPAPERL